MVSVLTACLVVGLTGLIIGVLLGVAGNVFSVEVNEKEEKIREELPGNNCGGCGYAGCDALAKAIANGEAAYNACPVGGNPVASKIADILGVESEESNKMVAFVKCNGDCNHANQRFEYYGTQDCNQASLSTGGGPKECEYGCMGLGSCVKACEFDAIHIVNGIAVVDREKCVACKKCIAACPKKLIELVPYNNKYFIACNSKDLAKSVIKACKVGCISCRQCERNCPVNAIEITDNLAKIDYEKCVSCGKCQSVCKRDIILSTK